MGDSAAIVFFPTLPPFRFTLFVVPTFDVMEDSVFFFFPTLARGDVVDVFFLVVSFVFEIDMLLLLIKLIRIMTGFFFCMHDSNK